MGECHKSDSFCSEHVTCPCCQAALPAPRCWGLSIFHSRSPSAPYEEGTISPLFSPVPVYLASLGPTVLVFFHTLTEVEFYGSLLVIHDKLRGVISKMQQGAWALATQTQGWQSNDSSLLAGTFHHAYLINDSTSPRCPGGELSTTRWLLFSLVLRSHPLCSRRQSYGHEELPRDIECLEEQSSWKDSCQRAATCSTCSGFASPLEQGEAQRSRGRWQCGLG